MTWQEFKEILESKGVKDNSQVMYIDVSVPYNGLYVIEVIHKGNIFYAKN